MYLVIVVVFVSCGRKYYQRDEAIRSLKVLNSDFTNFFTKAGEMEEMAALKFIWDHDSMPLPFPYEKYVADKPWHPYDYEASKGIYRWDSVPRAFIRTSGEQAVKVLFTTEKFQKGEFILTKYVAAKLSSRPDFPTVLDAVLKLRGEERMKIRHLAEVADDLPLRMNSGVKTKDSELHFQLNRTKENDSGDLYIQVYFENKGYRFIEAQMDASVGYSSMGYYYKDIRFDIKAFNHRVNGRINYGKVDPTARDYANSFNANSDIQISEMPGNIQVGKLVLGKSGNGELLDYFIRFTDGSQVHVAEYLPFLDKLLNMKL